MDVSQCTSVGRQFSVFASSSCPTELGLSSTSTMATEVVDEGSEPAEFIKALGSQDKKAYDCMLQGGSSLVHETSGVFTDFLRELTSRDVCVVSRSREVQLHATALPAECQLRSV